MISSFKMALRSIGSNKMRAALTMLGIIIGVMALVVLVSLVNGATNTVTDEVSSLGSNYVDAYVWRQEVGSSLTINDLRKWAQENEYVEAVAPVNTGEAKGKAGSASDSISLYGTMPAFADINGLTIEYGRFLKNTDVDNSSRVCVLSKQAAEQIVGYADCVGEDFSIDGMRYTIPESIFPLPPSRGSTPRTAARFPNFTSPRRRARKWPTPRQPSTNSSMTFSATATASTSIP